MNTYSFLNIPESCFLGTTIYKKLFYENADLSTSDKSQFTDTISKIVWLYCLKPDTINISAYQDEVRDYPEIEVIEVLVHKDNKLDRIAEIIMRTIPYPMLLIFRLEDNFKFYLAHQMISLKDRSKNTIEELTSTDWLTSDSELLAKLNIRQMRFKNYNALYSDMMDVISIYNLSSLMPTSNMTGAEAREISVKLESLDQEITSLRNRLKRENQFNRKMELNIEIKKLDKKKDILLGGEK